MELSWIQKHIIAALLRKPSARLKELQPADMPANQFSYHLEGLIAQKIVLKVSRGVYTLTPRGERVAGTFSTSHGQQVEYIKTVILLYGKREDQYLLYRWSRQPYLGCVTPPHKQLPRGTSLNDGLDAALNEKLGSHKPLIYKTSALITITHDNELVSHLNALVYEVSLDEVELPRVMRNGEVFLASTHETERIMDGVEEFLDKLETATSPFDSVWKY